MSERRLAEAGPAFTALVAVRAEGPAGFAILGTPRYESEPDACELRALYVDPAAWRRGIGGALLDEAERHATAAGARRLALWCIAGNRGARRLYESHGFAGPQGERTTTALAGHPLDEVLYLKRLENLGSGEGLEPRGQAARASMLGGEAPRTPAVATRRSR